MTHTPTFSRHVRGHTDAGVHADAVTRAQVSKGAAASSVQEFIAKVRRHCLPSRLQALTCCGAQDVAAHAVLVYMKGTPTAPQCGFSNMVCRILDSHGTCACTAASRQRPALNAVCAQALHTPAGMCCRTPSCVRGLRSSRELLHSTTCQRATSASLTATVASSTGPGQPFRRCSSAASSWCAVLLPTCGAASKQP